MIRDFSYLFKVVLVGNSSVGKSSLLRRFADDSFQESYLATIGVDFRFKSVTVSGDVVKLQIWDTAGQQRFRTITGAYYKGAHAIVLVYDITRPDTFTDFEDFWLDEIQKHAVPNVKIYVLGNKSDQSQKRKVSEEEASNFCRKKNIVWKEVSAKNGEGVSESFYEIAQELTKIYPKQQRKQAKKSSNEEIEKKKKQFQLQTGTQPTKTKNSCCKL